MSRSKMLSSVKLLIWLLFSLVKIWMESVVSTRFTGKWENFLILTKKIYWLFSGFGYQEIAEDNVEPWFNDAIDAGSEPIFGVYMTE